MSRRCSARPRVPVSGVRHHSRWGVFACTLLVGALPPGLHAIAAEPPTAAPSGAAQPQPGPDAAAEPTSSPTGPGPVDVAATPGFGLSGIPAVSYDADNGLGLGAVASAYFYDGRTRPYRTAVTLQIFATTLLVQDHNVVVDALKVGGLPLRLNIQVGYRQSLTQNFCGLGGAVTCDPDEARAVGRAQSLQGARLNAFMATYYRVRFVEPYAQGFARATLVERTAASPFRLEAVVGYRGLAFIPGTWDDENHDGAPDLVPYPGSLYGTLHPDGEPGFLSALLGGFFLDSRDNEAAPTRGLALTVLARGAAPFLGSTWTFVGAHVALKSYVALAGDGAVVFANRVFGDAVVGAPPVQELTRIGGLEDHYVFGGADVGRGVRVQRNLGNIKLVDQAELRWRFVDFALFEQSFSLTAAAFADVGIVGVTIDEPGPLVAVPGFGAGLRLGWNQNFVIRFDVGTSAAEAFAIAPYLVVGTPF